MSPKTKKEHLVYQIDLSDGKQYVGITKNLKQRMAAHRTHVSASQVARHLHDNPGVSVSDFQILASSLTRKQASSVERKAMRSLKDPLNGKKIFSGKNNSYDRRITITFSVDEPLLIQLRAFEKGYSSTSAAIRHLLERGLEAEHEPV